MSFRRTSRPLTPARTHQAGGTDVRATVRRAGGIAIAVWPAFTLLDAYMCYVVYPGAPFRWFLAGRVVVEAVLVGVWWASRREGVPVRWLPRLQAGSFVVAAVTIALMAIPLGGALSPYMHGISIVALVRAAMLPASWRAAVPVFAAIGLSFPLVMVGWALVRSGGAALWPEVGRLSAFAGNYVFVISSSLIGLMTGHIVWTARQQLYRARRVGRYRLKAPIGEGGMGEVWLAWDALLRRNVALKLLRFEQAANPDFVARFEREAQAASQLRVPHSIQIYDFGASEDGIYFIAMEYLVGTDLSSLVRERGPLPPEQVIRFAIQICASLEEAHAAGIIHRDVKPQNLFAAQVGADREFIKLLDFGIARLRTLAPDAAQLTRTGQVAGTPAYLAPELWFGAEADERTDIYALGVTLYFLLTGATPYERGEAEHLMMAPLRGEPLAPSTARGEPVPEALERIVLRCLARDPEDRVQSAAELRQALEAIAVAG